MAPDSVAAMALVVGFGLSRLHPGIMDFSMSQFSVGHHFARSHFPLRFYSYFSFDSCDFSSSSVAVAWDRPMQHFALDQP